MFRSTILVNCRAVLTQQPAPAKFTRIKRNTGTSAAIPSTSQPGRPVMQPGVSTAGNSKLRRPLGRKPLATKLPTHPKQNEQFRISPALSGWDQRSSGGFHGAKSLPSADSGPQYPPQQVVRHPQVPNPAKAHPLPDKKRRQTRTWKQYKGEKGRNNPSPQQAAEVWRSDTSSSSGPDSGCQHETSKLALDESKTHQMRPSVPPQGFVSKDKARPITYLKDAAALKVGAAIITTPV